MRIPTADDIRRIAIQVTQPLVDGLIEVAGTFTAKINDLPDYGSGDQSRLTFPYGMVAKPIKGVGAYLLNLNGSLLAPIIVAYLDKKRPVPSTAGEVILYCLNADGSENPVRLTLKIDGTFVIDAETQINIGSEGSDEPLVLGTAFKTLYNVHAHVGNLGIPTGPPLVPMGLAHLSTKAFTEL